MKRMAMCSLRLCILVCLGSYSHAQALGKPAPKFTLSLAAEARDGTMVAYQQVFIVTYTNVSQDIAGERFCTEFGRLYKLVVIRNGTPIPESPQAQKQRTAAESGHCSGGSNPGRNLQPGQSRQDIVAYNTVDPGTYEFAVEENTDPLDASRNVTVKSNTVTVVVSASKAKPAK